MIITFLKIHNIYNFKNFSIGLSYPKKIINSTLGVETLKNRSGFRYKKVVVLMGANATGKTCLGRTIKNICSFINEGKLSYITKMICDEKEEAFIEMDFVNKENELFRIVINSLNSKVNVSLYQSYIAIKDTYNTTVSKLKKVNVIDFYHIKDYTGLVNFIFNYPEIDSNTEKNRISSTTFLKVLKVVLSTLDPSLKDLKILEGLNNSFVIKRDNSEIIIQDGKVLNKELLSSGTIEGVDIALFIASMFESNENLYYCDEHFSYVQTDIEKRIFQLMLAKLKDNEQLFFTTHNMDMLDLNLPKHSFALLKRNSEGIPSIVFISDLLKRNTDSVRCAVENDAFASMPDLSLLDELDDVIEE